MSKKDLWGNIEEAQVPKNPKKILKEQADVIGEKTRYVLTGRVIGGSSTKSGKPTFTATLSVEARRIANYTYDLLLVQYPLEMYPLELSSFATNKSYTCNTEEEFIDKLGEILSSEEVMKTITALLSQSTT
jgi:hypothetical protein